MSSFNEKDKPPAPPLRLSSQTNQPSTPKHQLHLNHLNQINLLNQTSNSPVNYYLKGNQLTYCSNNQTTTSQQSQQLLDNNQQATVAKQNFNKNVNLMNHIPVDQKPLPKEPINQIKECEIKPTKKNSSKHSKQSSSNKKTKKIDLNNDKNYKPVISPPTNFEHTFHVAFDAKTGTNEMMSMLN